MSATSFKSAEWILMYSIALLDEGAPETDQVRDIGNVIAVLAEPEDDPFGTFGSVDRHLIEGVFDRALGYAPKPGLREIWGYSFESSLVMVIEFLM